MAEIFEKVLLLGAETDITYITQLRHVGTYINSMVLKKSKNNFDCLINEMFLINDLSLNVQSDSLIAKVFV